MVPWRRPRAAAVGDVAAIIRRDSVVVVTEFGQVEAASVPVSSPVLVPTVAAVLMV